MAQCLGCVAQVTGAFFECLSEGSQLITCMENNLGEDNDCTNCIETISSYLDLSILPIEDDEE